ncbi:MAG: hypothetical protein GY950_07595 [bacterium]|nr:hypothetical protein [bacterium]
MNNADLKKEVEIFNNTFKKSNLFNLLKEVTKSGHFSIGIAMFSPPSVDRLKGKKNEKKLKETRKQLQKFFKEDRGKIALAKNRWVISLPEQLVKIFDLSAKPTGFNRKPGSGGELFSIVEVNKDSKENHFPGLTETLLLLNTVSETDSLYRCIAHVSFIDYKLKHVLPVDFRTPAEASDVHKDFPGILSIADLKELEVTGKNYRNLDKKAKEELDTGLNYLERIRRENDAHIKASLLSAALEFHLQSPEKDPAAVQWYFENICRDLAGKTGMELKNKTLFEEFNTGTRPVKKEITAEMERFYRLLLKKMAGDAHFLKQTVPVARAALKKELKKQAVKKIWRKFPGKYLALLFAKH